MLPFMKKKEGSASQNVEESLKRSPDSGEELTMLDAVVDDLMAAFESKDKALLKSALDALIVHIQDMDQEQDSQEGLL